MKILVLGGSGFVGGNVARYFADKGHEVHATHYTSAKRGWDDVTWHRLDLRENNYTLNQIMEGVDVVVQCAAATTGCKDTLQSPALHTANNAVMNSWIFKAAVDNKVKHLIFPSCSVMYPSKTMLSEDDFDGKINPAYLGFASTKLYCEKLCEFYAGISDTKFTVARNSNMYGPYDKYDLDRSHVFGATITKVLSCRDPKDKQGTVSIWGSGQEARDFFHVSDFCRFVEKAIAGQPSKYALYNVGSGEAVRINDLVAKVIKIAALGKDIHVKHDMSKPTIPTSLSLYCGKAAREIGWTPTVSLDDGIKDTINWWLNNVAVAQ